MDQLSDQITQARSQGYSDDDIVNHLSQSRNDLAPKIQEAQGNQYTSKDILDHLAIAPVRDTSGMQFPGESTGSVPLDVLSGIGASALSIPVGGYKLLRKAAGVMAPSLPLPPVSPFVEGLTKAPDTYSGKAGQFFGDAAEFMLPGGLEKKAMDLLSPTSTLGKIASRALISGTSAGAVEGVKSGGNAKQTGVAALTGGIGGGAAEGLTSKPVIKALTDLWGKATGVGGESIRTAASQASQKFTDAMRNVTTEDEIVQDFNNAVKQIRDQRNLSYQSGVQALDQTIKLNVAPVRQALKDQLKAFGVDPLAGKGKSFMGSTVVSPADRDAMLKAIGDVARWSDTSPRGMDTLKQRLTGYADQASPRVAPFFYRIAQSAGDELKARVPGYEKLVGDYESASNLLEQARSELSAGHDNPGTTMRKLSYALNQHNDYRKILIEAIDNAAGSNVKDQVAGYGLRGFTPRGLAGVMAGGAATYLHEPSLLFSALLASPRVAGESMALLSLLRRSGAGKLAQYVSPKNVGPALGNQLPAPPANLTPPPPQ